MSIDEKAFAAAMKELGIEDVTLAREDAAEAIGAYLRHLKRESGELCTEKRLEAINIIAKTIWPEAAWDGEQENANIAAIKVFHALIERFKITVIEGGQS